MKAEYREIPPTPRLAPYVECFWSLRVEEAQPAYPVLPDGCVDILFSQDGSQPGSLEVVGTMTRCHRFPVPAGRRLFGVRFRPGMSYGFLRAAGPDLVDQSAPLDLLWGPAAGRLQQRLCEAASTGQCIASFEAFLDRQPARGPVERAISWLAARSGQVSIDGLAAEAGISPRQLRRLCLVRTGLTPKRLCRILRFRHAAAQLHPAPFARRRPPADAAQLALDCGYYDQAHFINEFREFSGTSPGGYAALRGR